MKRKTKLVISLPCCSWRKEIASKDSGLLLLSEASYDLPNNPVWESYVYVVAKP